MLQIPAMNCNANNYFMTISNRDFKSQFIIHVMGEGGVKRKQNFCIKLKLKPQSYLINNQLCTKPYN